LDGDGVMEPVSVCEPELVCVVDALGDAQDALALALPPASEGDALVESEIVALDAGLQLGLTDADADALGAELAVSIGV